MEESKKMNSLAFQRMFISLCVIDPDYAKTVATDVHETYFNDILLPLWSATKKLIEDYGFASYEALEVEITRNDSPASFEMESIQREIKNLSGNTRRTQWIKDNVTTFIQEQEAKNALIQCMNLVKTGEYNKMIPLWQKVLQVGIGTNTGYQYENVDDRLMEESREVITTGVDNIDLILAGGIGKGQLGTVVAPSGVGKSWMLAKFGAGAYLAGKTVVHFTFELSEKYVGLRYDSLITQRSIEELRNDPSYLHSRIDASPGLVRIKEYPMASASVNTLKAYIERLKLNDIHPDLIIVDYGDLMIDTNSGEGRHGLNGIWMGLKGMAQELNVAVWTASQTNRSAVDLFTIDETTIGEEYRKIAHSDIVLSISRTVYDRPFNYARAFLIKQRHGPDKQLIPGWIDTTHGVIEFDSPHSESGKTLVKRMLRAKDQYEKTGAISNIDSDVVRRDLADIISSL